MTRNHMRGRRVSCQSVECVFSGRFPASGPAAAARCRITDGDGGKGVERAREHTQKVTGIMSGRARCWEQLERL